MRTFKAVSASIRIGKRRPQALLIMEFEIDAKFSRPNG
jgi:hypothetical protein